MNNDVRVIIVNFNAGDALARSVASVLASRESLSLLVADNHSHDGSCEKLRSLYSANQRLEIVENAENIGFSRAVNAVALPATEPFLLILNPDCELYPGTLAALRAALEQDPQAALAAPRIVDEHEQTLRGSLRRFPTPLKSFMTATGLSHLGGHMALFRGVEREGADEENGTCPAEAVSGACMMVRADRFRELGGFDEGYEMHFEDLDLMFRIHQHQWHCLYVSDARAFHLPGTSSRSRPLWVHFQKHRGMLRFYRKHQAGGHSASARALFNCGVWMHYLATLPLAWLKR